VEERAGHDNERAMQAKKIVALKVLMLYSCSTHALLILYHSTLTSVLILYVYSTHTLLILYSYSTHALLILYSYSTHALKAKIAGHWGCLEEEKVQTAEEGEELERANAGTV
jgi:hypothetical protein